MKIIKTNDWLKLVKKKKFSWPTDSLSAVGLHLCIGMPVPSTRPVVHNAMIVINEAFVLVDEI